jgi:RNA polymerase sigma-70 factor (ECF subfamily)
MARRRQLDTSTLEQHLDRLLRAALALCGNRDDAEDLVQETCARVLARPRRLARDDALPYLLGALRNVFLNERRTRSRRPQTVSAKLDAPSSLPSPARAAELHEVWALIADLPAELRDALVAVDVCGLTYGEAGRVLDVKEATIATRVFRARDRVARGLQ